MASCVYLGNHCLCTGDGAEGSGQLGVVVGAGHHIEYKQPSISFPFLASSVLNQPPTPRVQRSGAALQVSPKLGFPWVWGVGGERAQPEGGCPPASHLPKPRAFSIFGLSLGMGTAGCFPSFHLTQASSSFLIQELQAQIKQP